MSVHFDEIVKSFDFIKNIDETCVYKKASGSVFVFLLSYIDGILIIGNNISMLQLVKLWMSKIFSMKELGEASYILV